MSGKLPELRYTSEITVLDCRKVQTRMFDLEPDMRTDLLLDAIEMYQIRKNDAILTLLDYPETHHLT